MLAKRIGWALIVALCIGVIAGCEKAPSVSDQPPAGTGSNNGPMSNGPGGTMNAPPSAPR